MYDQLVDALRKQGKPGDLIPPELELSAELGVSRTVLREALRLLEEDGIIERGIDPRRRQLAMPSSRPSAFNAPLEDMLYAGDRISVRVIRTELIVPTAWSSALLELSRNEVELVCRESLFSLGTEPVASALEVVPVTDVASASYIGSIGREATAGGETLLAALGPQFRSRCAPTLWRLAATSSGGGSRTGFSRSRPDDPVTSLTTVLSRNGKPVYLAKHLLRLNLVLFAVGGNATEIGPLLSQVP
ncbi:GntR family transcriptional regulator [Breoghania sp.]|uniref:GntR family transcriptional regulator n=1 Tax=Breoghania sp. TaxID=2065378 RepID=UPI0026113464|nr:GntR family transcriptional regulator [Breoghania sp.]MDJ0933088.1 GntR family transcriptional regulator [Breoghania sp.]